MSAAENLYVNDIGTPVSALFCVPFVQQNCMRMFDGNRDVTPDVDHVANRRSCALANTQNATVARRWGVAAPYYHYDALSGRALVIAPPSPHSIDPKKRDKPEGD